MPTPGRNDPCPCGSGKKYKKCCLSAQATTRDAASRSASIGAAMEWLLDHHPLAMREAIMGEFLASLREPERRPMASLPPWLQQMIVVNGNDWLLAEGEIVVGGERRRASEVVLGPGGAPLEAADRDWIAALATAPLRLWEVQEVRPGEGVWLKDLLDPAAEACWVVERTGSKVHARWDVVAARTMANGRELVFSGCVYPFDRMDLPELRKAVSRALRPKAVNQDPTRAATALSLALRERWLADLTLPREIPNLVDGATGEPLLLVTDHYQVRDWGKLAERLATAADAEGNHREGWRRFKEVPEAGRDLLLSINVRHNNRIETFARTRRLADEGRAWLERLAGDAVSFLESEAVDPRERLNQPEELRQRRGPPPASIPMTTEMSQAMYDRFYRGWADRPIGVLGDKTPRQALRTKPGRQAVIDLLKTYEHGELRRAKEEEREPASLEFLWQALGLEPEVIRRSKLS